LVQTRNAGSDDYQHTKEGSKGKEERKRMLVLFFDSKTQKSEVMTI
jgi:hypothetical protein